MNNNLEYKNMNKEFNYLTCNGDLNISDIILQVFFLNSNGTRVFGKFVSICKIGILDCVYLVLIIKL